MEKHLEAVGLPTSNIEKLGREIDKSLTASLELFSLAGSAKHELDSLFDTTESLDVLLDASDLGHKNGSRVNGLHDGANALGNLPKAAGLKLSNGNIVGISGQLDAGAAVVVLDKPLVGSIFAFGKDIVGNGGDSVESISKGKAEISGKVVVASIDLEVLVGLESPSFNRASDSGKSAGYDASESNEREMHFAGDIEEIFDLKRKDQDKKGEWLDRRGRKL